MRSALKQQQEQAYRETPNETLKAIDSINSYPIESAYLDIYKKLGVHFADFGANWLTEYKMQTFDIELKNELDPVWSVAMENYVRTLGERIVDVTQTTKAELQKVTQQVIDEGFENGWGIDRMGREIRKRSGITNVYRAQRIARTETVNAANVGVMKGAESTGLALNKIWLTALDGRERATHADANNQKVDQNGKFSVGGALMDHPGDPAGGADNVINCRCAIAYEPKVLAGN